MLWFYGFYQINELIIPLISIQADETQYKQLDGTLYMDSVVRI
jgi:hypothetical protein